jgi:hypothetical protein
MWNEELGVSVRIKPRAMCDLTLTIPSLLLLLLLLLLRDVAP